MNKTPDAEAILTFLTTAKGGRKTPCRSTVGGYRAQCDFGLKDAWNDVYFDFIHAEWVSPGESTKSRLWFLYPDFQLGRLYDGFEFTVHEGRPLVARGKITKVFNDLL